MLLLVMLLPTAGDLTLAPLPSACCCSATEGSNNHLVSCCHSHIGVDAAGDGCVRYCSVEDTAVCCSHAVAAL
jgi:hypothetical protein